MFKHTNTSDIIVCFMNVTIIFNEDCYFIFQSFFLDTLSNEGSLLFT